MVNCATNHTVVLNRTGHNTTCIQLQEQTVQVNVPPMTEEAKIVFICLFATIFFLGVTGNAVVCWVVGELPFALPTALCIYLLNLIYPLYSAILPNQRC